VFIKALLLASILISDTDPAIKDFNERVQRYWDIHKKLEDAAPPIDKKKEQPEAIVQHQRALADGIAAVRRNASEGDIFTPEAQKVFIETINRELRSSARGAKSREMVLGDGNPRHPESAARVDLVVNAKYPPNAPLSTMPPTLLLNLPKLPQGLEYRFVGKHLILYDSKANLIVDILRNAIR
jgi:hypothetical protein